MSEGRLPNDKTRTTHDSSENHPPLESDSILTSHKLVGGGGSKKYYFIIDEAIVHLRVANEAYHSANVDRNERQNRAR